MCVAQIGGDMIQVLRLVRALAQVFAKSLRAKGVLTVLNMYSGIRKETCSRMTF